MGKLRPGEKGLSDLYMILEQAEINPGTALEVQWLKLFASIARGVSSITSRGTKMLINQHIDKQLLDTF